MGAQRPLANLRNLTPTRARWRRPPLEAASRAVRPGPLGQGHWPGSSVPADPCRGHRVPGRDCLGPIPYSAISGVRSVNPKVGFVLGPLVTWLSVQPRPGLEGSFRIGTRLWPWRFSGAGTLHSSRKRRVQVNQSNGRFSNGPFLALTGRGDNQGARERSVRRGSSSATGRVRRDGSRGHS